MPEGTIDIIWANRDNPTATRRYRVLFLGYGPGFPDGPQPHKEIVGDLYLFNYLVDLQAATITIERRTERARQWLLEIHGSGNLSLDNMQLSDRQFAPFRLAS